MSTGYENALKSKARKRYYGAWLKYNYFTKPTDKEAIARAKKDLRKAIIALQFENITKENL